MWLGETARGRSNNIPSADEKREMHGQSLEEDAKGEDGNGNDEGLATAQTVSQRGGQEGTAKSSCA